MNGTQLFILALVAIVGIFVLLLLSARLGTPAAAEFSMENVFSLKFSMSPAVKNEVTEAVAAAALARGQSGDKAANDVRSHLKMVEKLQLRRLLWVDDHPDNNIYESLALTGLGFTISVATSNQAARVYLSQARYDLVITDFGRDGYQETGEDLVKELAIRFPGLPVIVYTMDAAKRRHGLTSDGAIAVEDSPDGLIGAVLSAFAPDAGA